MHCRNDIVGHLATGKTSSPTGTPCGTHVDGLPVAYCPHFVIVEC